MISTNTTIIQDYAQHTLIEYNKTGHIIYEYYLYAETKLKSQN